MEKLILDSVKDMLLAQQEQTQEFAKIREELSKITLSNKTIEKKVYSIVTSHFFFFFLTYSTVTFTIGTSTNKFSRRAEIFGEEIGFSR